MKMKRTRQETEFLVAGRKNVMNILLPIIDGDLALPAGDPNELHPDAFKMLVKILETVGW